MAIPRAIKTWVDRNKTRKKSLAISGKNTARLRRRIKEAKKQNRFFAYLSAVNPCLPIGLFSTLAAIEPILRSEAGWFTMVTKLVTLVSAFATIFMQIQMVYWKFRRNLKIRQKRISANAIDQASN
jgi:hypothetical protein